MTGSDRREAPGRRLDLPAEQDHHGEPAMNRGHLERLPSLLGDCVQLLVIDVGEALKADREHRSPVLEVGRHARCLSPPEVLGRAA